MVTGHIHTGYSRRKKKKKKKQAFDGHGIPMVRSLPLERETIQSGCYTRISIDGALWFVIRCLIEGKG